MRVTYVIDSLAAGGAERSLVSIAPYLLERGLELRVVTVHDRSELRPDLERLGVDVGHLTSARRLGRVTELTELLRSTRPQLVHTTLFEADIAGRLAARMARIPSVSTLANVSYGPDHAVQPGIRALRLRSAQASDIATAHLVRRFHAVSAVVATAMARRLLIPRRRIDVVHRGRDSVALGRRTPERAAVVRATLALGPDAPLLVAVARHEYDKGLDVAIRAMPEIRRTAPGAILFVAGRQGNQTADLMRLAGAAGCDGAVRLFGPRDDVADLLAAADVFVAPSRREGLPGAVIEAMALEAPIVASALPAVEEAVGHDGSCARLVPVGSVDALATAVVDALQSVRNKDERTAKGRERFERMFTIESAAVGMLAFYERAVRG